MQITFSFRPNRVYTLHYSILIKFWSVKTFSFIQSKWKLLHFERLLQFKIVNRNKYYTEV